MSNTLAHNLTSSIFSLNAPQASTPSASSHSLSASIEPSGGGDVLVSAPTSTLSSVLAPFFRGPAGGVSEEEVTEIAAQQDAVLVYDFDALVGATLSI